MRTLSDFMSDAITEHLLKTRTAHSTSRESVTTIDEFLDILMPRIDNAARGETIDLNDIDVSGMTNMYYMLSISTLLREMRRRGSEQYYHDPLNFLQTLNYDVSDWDVSNVETMEGLFNSQFSFNCDLSRWDTRSLSNMRAMFASCHSFDSDVNNFNVSKVTDAASAFVQCRAFNSPLDKWDVSGIADMTRMFAYCELFNQPLDMWQPKSVIHADMMFYKCSKFKQNIDSWETVLHRIIKFGHEMFKHSGINRKKPKWYLGS